MRDDMHEVIIERPRWGSRMRHARRLRRVDPKRTSQHDPESLPFRVGHGRAASLNKRTKEFSDLLGPLKRYLARQVNRPWDKVWSEICKNLKAENPAQRHVRLHVHDFVAINTCVRDGAVWVVDRWGRADPLADGHEELYVDPRTRILRRNKFHKQYRQRRREKAADAARERALRMREISPFLQAHLLDDQWWEVTLAPVRAEYYWCDWHPASDVVIGAGLTRLRADELYGRRGVYAVKRRQLKSAEIARLGLKT
jgi:hypothetical protein